MAIGLGIGLKFGGAVTIDSQAETHFNRVVADGGTIPAGLVGCDAWFKAVKGVYGVSDITSAISCAYDPQYLGYKLGAGSGATLGSAVQKLYSCCGSTSDLIQTTAASQPLILPHTGTNYAYLPGVANNNFTTPNAAANIISGNLELTAYNIRWSGSASTRYLISKTDTYSLSIATSNSLTLEYRIGGSVLVAASTSTISTSFSGSVRAFRNSTTGEVTFYTSTDNINFTQLGSVVSGTSGVISNLTNSIFVGSYNSTIATWQGSIGRATIATSLGGNPVVDFNPASYSASTSQTQWTSSTGEVWTINTGTATTGYKGILVDRTITQGDGIDDRLISTITLLDGHTNYCSFRATSQDGSGNRAIYGNGTTSLNNTLCSLSTNQIFTSLTSALFGGLVANTLNTLSMATTQWATNNTKTKINNGTFGSTISGAYVGGAGYNLFSTAGFQFGNPFISTNIISSSVDNSTIQTAMYNLIRGINNNAF